MLRTSFESFNKRATETWINIGNFEVMTAPSTPVSEATEQSTARISQQSIKTIPLMKVSDARVLQEMRKYSLFLEHLWFMR